MIKASRLLSIICPLYTGNNPENYIQTKHVETIVTTKKRTNGNQLKKHVTFTLNEEKTQKHF